MSKAKFTPCVNLPTPPNPLRKGGDFKGEPSVREWEGFLCRPPHGRVLKGLHLTR
ncbi:hypothetical protein [Campylobacter troglodytis]|uniref:hypothetical protein n=1 Tax=Campylobacter troglodytis TaxID=654363 RepID=UPI00163BE6F0|nr:hypothetical protein [Campylobacter troglodytis]